jgi:signal transduction histidine kinase
VMVNLLSNSVKFTDTGFINVKIEKIESVSELQMMKISVVDSGKGIEKIEAIGKLFSNLEVIENVNQSGIGFGLNISNRIIERLGGSMNI